MLLAIGIIFALHIIGFLNAFLRQSDRFTDIIYALSFFIIALTLFLKLDNPSNTHLLLLLMISIWAVRLGTYLGYRIKIWGHDRRFDAFRGEWHRLIKFWVLQFVSIMIIALPILFGMSASEVQLNTISFLGVGIYLIGLIIETVADYQKFVFKQVHTADQSFIQSGLWRRTRHPNYLGEWFVWVGIFIFCLPLLEGWQLLSILSPIWMFVLLRFISGGNLLEKAADKKYGDLPEYHAYKKQTGVFFPKL